MEPEEIISAREKTHGNFARNAIISQSLKQVVRTYSEGLNLTQQESLDLICTKIGRILAGDPYYADHWNDIAGYAKLAADRSSK